MSPSIEHHIARTFAFDTRERACMQSLRAALAVAVGEAQRAACGVDLDEDARETVRPEVGR